MQESSNINWDKYEVSVSDAEQTGIRLFHLRSRDTGTVVSFAEFNEDFDVHSGVAWAGARTSRSNAAYEDIFAEIQAAAQEGKNVAGEKLQKFFVKYGHASVAGMSPVFLYLHNVPMHAPLWLFNHTSVGDGQELSTRYVRLENLGIAPLASLVNLDKVTGLQKRELQTTWEELQETLVRGYHKWYDKVRERFEQEFNPSGEEVSDSTLNARTLDVVRMWIPLGASTSMALLNSVRMWIDLVSQLREKQDPELLELAEQINAALNLSEHPQLETAVKADLSGLTKYAYPRKTIGENLAELEEFLQQELPSSLFESTDQEVAAQPTAVQLFVQEDEVLQLIAQYILSLYPSVSNADLLEWLKTLPTEKLARLGDIIFRKHNHHNLMRNMGDIRGQHLFEIKTAVAYIRDLNRHRAWGRFIPMLETSDFEAILAAGFNDNLQMREAVCLQDLREEFNADLTAYYQKLKDFYGRLRELLGDFPEEVLWRLLPLGHQVTMQMSAPLTQQVYAISQRIGGGGDMGYRRVVYDMLQQLRQQHVALGSFLAEVKEPVDVNSSEQFASRK